VKWFSLAITIFLGIPPYPNVGNFARAWDQVKVHHPGKAKRAARNAECYAFFVNVGAFLAILQKTRLYNDARKKKKEKEKHATEKAAKKRPKNDVVGNLFLQVRAICE